MPQSLPRLTRALLAGLNRIPADVERPSYANLPERILQIGEGNFLRGFVDWMIHRLDQRGLFNGSVVVVQPRAGGIVRKLVEQDGLYTLLSRGLQDGKVVERKELIGVVSRGIDPYKEYATFLRAAHNPHLRFITSNTTEAGIVFSASDRLTDQPPASFPGKLTAFLHERYKAFDGDPSNGFVLLPTELIERNGDQLRSIVLQLARAWELDPKFIDWIERANTFVNSLVDRIVTGYPKDEAPALLEQLGYDDAMLDAAEVYHAWVIEGSEQLAEELPFDQVGLNVTWTDDVTPYRERKVRILNGGHTMMVPAAFLAGKDTVKQCVDDPAIAGYLRRGLFEEILPTLDLPRAELEAFANAVLERFANPFVKHQLLSIALNSTSKFKARVLPTIREFVRRRGAVPPRLSFALAALIAFYRGTEVRDGALIGHRAGTEYRIQDDPAALEVFRRAWSAFRPTPEAVLALVGGLLAPPSLWGEDLNILPGLAPAVAGHLRAILDRGAAEAMAHIDRS